VNTLSLSNVNVNLGESAVLRSVNLDVPPGSLVAIVGPSGCGKTTLLRTIAGLQRARSGDIRLGQRMLTTHGLHLAPEKRQIGWVPQDAALFPHLTVAENVAFGLGARGGAAGDSRSLRKRSHDARVTELLALVGLESLADRSPAQLSGGQAQRVALARALAVSPQLVLLDEPFAALDPVLRAELRIEVRALLRTQGVTGILVTHDQSEALSVADYVAVMNEGEILQFGTPPSVYGRPATPWVAHFVGDAVVLPGMWSHGSVSSALGNASSEWVSTLPAPADGVTVSLMVRPEQLVVAVGEDHGAPATVNSVSYTGHDAVLGLVLDDGTVCESRVTAAGLLSAGTRVTVQIAGTCLAYPV